MDRLKLFLPLVIFAIMAVFFWAVLSDEDYDPKALPSALLGKDFPEFSLTDLDSGKTLTKKDIIGEPMLVNVWATWCISCKVEHPYLNELSRNGIKIVGIDYKDERPAALDWLKRLGNPYALNIYDEDGKLGLDLGVYGAPETYIVDSKGVIRYKHVGIVNGKVWAETLKPVFDGLK